MNRKPVLLLSAILALQTGISKPSSAEDRDIHRLITKLESPEREQRLAAARVLLTRGLPAKKALEQSLAKTNPRQTSPDFRVLASVLIRQLGLVHNGLELRIKADRTRLKDGEDLTLTTTIANVSSHTLTFHFGGTLTGSILENGQVFEVLLPQSNGSKKAELSRAYRCAKVCGHSLPLIKELGAGQSLVIKTKARLRMSDPDRPGLLLQPYLQFPRGVFRLKVAKSGRHRFQAIYFIEEGYWQRQRRLLRINTAGIRWEGEAVSNVLELSIEP